MPSACKAGAAELAEGGAAASSADGLDPEPKSGQVGRVAVSFVVFMSLQSSVSVICRNVSRGSLQNSLPESSCSCSYEGGHAVLTKLGSHVSACELQGQGRPLRDKA